MMTTATAVAAADAPARDDVRRAVFNEKFAAALTVFGENLVAWQRGCSWEQTCELRRPCAEHHVAFDPSPYDVADSGMVTGWVGGPDGARPRVAGGTAYVGVTRDGDVYGMPGRISSRASRVSNGNDGRSS